MTYREQFESALACETKEQADKWLVREVERYRAEFGKDEAEALYIIHDNLGYMAGYYDHATAQKIHALFGANHPIFGTADYHETATPKQCMEAGKAAVEARASHPEKQP